MHQLGKAGPAVAAAIEDWGASGKLRRLWKADASLWTGADEDRWLGWLDIAASQVEDIARLQAVAADVVAGGFQHVLLLGMGGSSLCPEVLAQTFGRQQPHPELRVLDSTVPAQVLATANAIDSARTLFIVSSKSGGTEESNVLMEYFLDAARSAVEEDAPRHFVAITDPGSSLEARAQSEGFRSIAHGVPEIGGRFSALSDFGMLPAAAMGLDVGALLDRAVAMARACGPDADPATNPGLELGVILGVLAAQGRDKLTLVASPPIESLGAWLEQLVAESTGKHGHGLVPVDGESLAAPDAYGDDRLFVYLRTDPACAEQDAAIDALERAGQPVVRIPVASRLDLAAEFFRWEFATAVSGAMLGVNPFDQPDVEAAKVATRSLTAAYAETGRLPETTPFFEEDGVKLVASTDRADALMGAAGSGGLSGLLGSHLASLEAGDYFAINAVLERNDEHDARLQSIRNRVRDAKHVATTVGYGPRFLHSTGQLHKGGPNSGVFLQITADAADAVSIPGRQYGFDVLIRAQALGDFQVLMERDRRALHVMVGSDVSAALTQIERAIQSSR
jgi:transaldolase/glucose-6-phosphate isomerase